MYVKNQTAPSTVWDIAEDHFMNHVKTLFKMILHG
jgi:hypothetical protein